MILVSTALALDCGGSATPDACDLANRTAGQINDTAGFELVRDTHPKARLRPAALEPMFATISEATPTCTVEGSHGGLWRQGTWNGSWSSLDGTALGTAAGTFDPQARTWSGTWTDGVAAGQDLAVYHPMGRLAGDRDGGLTAGRWIRRSGRRGVYATRYGPCDTSPLVAIADWFPGDIGASDQDQDGSPAAEDCDDDDPLAFPGADEICDGVDNDCDGGVDEGFHDGFETLSEPFEDAPYDLSDDVVPEVVLGSGACSFPDPFFGFPLNLVPGQTVVSSGFTPADPGDAYSFETAFTSGVIDLGAFLLAAGQLDSNCYVGSVGFSSVEPIRVTVWVDGVPYQQTGTSGSISFQLSLFELFGTAYQVEVEPVTEPATCASTYTLNLTIP